MKKIILLILLTVIICSDKGLTTKQQKEELIKKGMSFEEVIGSIGHPIKANIMTGSYGINKQCMYKDDLYLYFDNNNLTFIDKIEEREKDNNKEGRAKLKKIIEIENPSKKILQAVDNHDLIIGMRYIEVIVSIGPPITIHRSSGSWGIFEQLIYDDNLYLYLINIYC